MAFDPPDMGRDLGKESFFDPETLEKKIADLNQLQKLLDDEYTELARQIDTRYNVSCLRSDGTRPGYKFADYVQSRYVWQNACLIEHAAGKQPRYDPTEERCSERLRRRFEELGWKIVRERDSPARYLCSVPITFTDDHLDAIISGISGRPIDSTMPRWHQFFRTKGGNAFEMFARDPLVELVKKCVKPGDHVLVYGSVVPYFECLCLLNGANVTSSTSLDIRYATSRVVARRLDLNELSSFDHIIAPLSIGSAGLGLFGEPVQPDEDVTLLRHLQDFLKKDGCMLLSLYTGPATVLYNAARIYEREQLNRLFVGYSVNAEERRQEDLYGLPLGKEYLVPDFRARLTAFQLIAA